MTFILARTGSGRPSLQHVLDLEDLDRSSCGLDISIWSRAYMRDAIPQILCKKCGKK